MIQRYRRELICGLSRFANSQADTGQIEIIGYELLPFLSAICATSSRFISVLLYEILLCTLSQLAVLPIKNQHNTIRPSTLHCQCLERIWTQGYSNYNISFGPSYFLSSFPPETSKPYFNALIWLALAQVMPATIVGDGKRRHVFTLIRRPNSV